MNQMSIMAIDDGDGRIVRSPRTTDAVGTAMRDVFKTFGNVPDDMRRLLQRLDQSDPSSI